MNAPTQPRSSPPEPPGGGGGGVGAPAPPTVVSQKVIGGYAVSVLRGGTRETVLGWLDAHHYALPSGAGPILSGYIHRRWYFVAIRLSRRTAGEIKPLAISFAANRLVYPMRLSRVATEPVNLDLFLNTDGPVVARGATALRTTFRAGTASIHRQLSARVRALLPGSYLEKVVIRHGSPSAIRSDITALPAPG